MTEKAIIVSKEDLSLVENNSLNQNQLGHLLKKTPAKYIKKRPAKGGGDWNYVTGGYVKKCLNLMFGWNWDFEIVSEEIIKDQVVIKGKLTCRTNGNTIVKMQFGCKEIMFKNEYIDGKKTKTDNPLNIGNDMKAAATDCLKKCAAEIGIAADVYNPEEFREIQVQEPITYDELKELFEVKAVALQHEDQLNVERILETRETASYQKVYNTLKDL